MSSVCRFISNSKGSGDYYVVTFDDDIIHQGHNLSFYAMFELFKYYGGQADIVEYEEVTDEKIRGIFMSIKNGFHYDDYNRRYYRDEQGDKIPEDICICYAHEPEECGCDCTSWNDYIYDDYDYYEDDEE